MKYIHNCILNDVLSVEVCHPCGRGLAFTQHTLQLALPQPSLDRPASLTPVHNPPLLQQALVGDYSPLTLFGAAQRSRLIGPSARGKESTSEASRWSERKRTKALVKHDETPGSRSAKQCSLNEICSVKGAKLFFPLKK